jgi:hypothetical protein
MSLTATDQQAPVALNPQGGSALAGGAYDSLAALVGWALGTNAASAFLTVDIFSE